MVLRTCGKKEEDVPTSPQASHGCSLEQPLPLAAAALTKGVQFSFFRASEIRTGSRRFAEIKKKMDQKCRRGQGKIQEMVLLQTHRRWVLPTSRNKMGCFLLPAFKRRLMVPRCPTEYQIHQEAVPGSEPGLAPKDLRTRCLSTRERTTTSSRQPSTTFLLGTTGLSRCLHPILHGKISSQVPCSSWILRIGTSTRSFLRESLASST